MTTLVQTPEPITPTEEERRQATETSRMLAPLIERDSVMRIVAEDAHSEAMPLPAPARRLLYEILRQMAVGNAVTVLPVHAELTTQQAADYLNVSRPYLVKLLDDGEIPFHKIGTHRRVQIEDVVAYKRNIIAKRHAALDELTALSQELGLYDA